MLYNHDMKSTPLGPIVGIVIIILLLLAGAVYSLQKEVARLKSPPQATSTTIYVRTATTTIMATSTAAQKSRQSETVQQ